MDRPNPANLTPGVLDGYAKRAFTGGACGALALALHDVIGWPIVAVTDHHNIYDGMVGGGSALHYAVRHPGGLLLDVDGLHYDRDLVEQYEGDADDGRAATGTTTREDVWDWYVEAQGEPIPLELAKTFVPAVLALSEQHRPAPLSVEEVQQRVFQVAAKALANDDEAAHTREDDLYTDVLRAVAAGASDSAELAAAALETRNLTFERWGG